MNSITQDIKFKQSVIKYSFKNGVTAAALTYNLHRKTIYRWIKKCDGTLASLVNKLRKPHRSPHAKSREKKTMFEKKLEELGINHKLIKPYTPRHNGKVERSHRKDQERFYYKKVFISIEDLKNAAKYWIKEYNNFPMRPLKWLSPKEKYVEYIAS